MAISTKDRTHKVCRDQPRADQPNYWLKITSIVTIYTHALYTACLATVLRLTHCAPRAGYCSQAPRASSSSAKGTSSHGKRKQQRLRVRENISGEDDLLALPECLGRPGLDVIVRRAPQS
eukprot:1128002-Pelagomonas_calceolata.AAC.10